MANYNYKYHLATWHERNKRLVCPRCGRGRGCYKEYVDDSGTPVDPESHTCGKCDHGTTCGYHVTPNEYFSANNITDERTVVRVEIPPRPMLVIDRELVVRTMACYEKNTFVKWLKSLPWDEEQRECIPMLIFNYCLGTSRDGGVIYWQIDDEGRVRTGKKMLYDSTGHRLKDEEGNSVGFNWIHSMMQRKGMKEIAEYEMTQCLFGQHLIANADPKKTTIHIVESEKTAVLMAMFDKDAMDRNLWMACGGLYNLNPTKLMPFRKYRVIVYPDANGIDRWREQVSGMDNITVETKWMSAMTDEDPPGADIADILLRRLLTTDEAVFKEMKKKHPPLNSLAEKLKLEVIHKQ